MIKKASQKTVDMLHQQIKNIKYREFHHYGHFTYDDMQTTEFPELLNAVLR
ncbi:MAG: hypothetical protein UX35_C0016G0019 [Microgenomates group bacterium GW2011_GWA1_46_15]|nr:MAG: hypothetical protein UX00_C0015G0021 [Microgenomates group bacterium GW2011_GWB1_45_17]KKU22775.1 MAG: hypothetical protein UX35_C0016G0019 [Microgenomates group bacterium GW2011_GWA1_46_15]KKU24038.1 MAG: hypothetical protein UX36_C0002G0021 [Microgenomates group bacterium GW2011_GWC1_46_15]